MKITFDVLADMIPANDKKENIKFLLSGEIVNCSNSLSPDNFFILKEKGNEQEIYIDKNVFTKIENELTDVINNYIKDDLKHLKKINKANNKNNDLFLVSKSLNRKDVININTIESTKKLISDIVEGTKSSSLKKNIFCKNNVVNLFLKKEFFGNIVSKSIDEIISDKKNEKIVINLGCELPYKPDNNKILLIELGSKEAANNKVIYKNDIGSIISSNPKKDIVSIDKLELTKFEVLFNFLNSNINEMYEVICKYNNCKEINEFSTAFNISGNSEKLFQNIYKEINGANFNNHIEKYEKNYYEFNESAKSLNYFRQDYSRKAENNLLKKNDNDQLFEMTKKIESNVESLKIQLDALKPFSIACEEYQNKMNNVISNLIKKGEKASCSTIKNIQEKANEYKNILTNCIKRKESGFLSKIYKFFFYEKHQKNMDVLNEYLGKINNILYYFESYSNNKQSVLSNDEIIKISTSILSETPPRNLLSYLYGENKKWNNFKKSLYNQMII